MAEDFQATGSQCQSDVEGATCSSSIGSGINNNLDMMSCTMGNSENSKNQSTLPVTSEAPPTNGSSAHHHKTHHSTGDVKEYYTDTDRFCRTAAVLQHSGLLKPTLQISQLVKANEELQNEIDQLQNEVMIFTEKLKGQVQQKQSEENVTSLQHEEKK